MNFRKTEISNGMFPLEIGVQRFMDVVFEETSETLKIVGTKTKDGTEPFFASGIHLGHPISKILKQ